MNLRGRNKISPHFNMSSMTDIVFLLLVFFMLSSPVVTPEALDLILPKGKGKTTSHQDLAVSIDENHNVYINKQLINKNQLELELQKRMKNTEDPTIILRTAQSVPIQEAVDIMSIAKRNQYKIILAVKP
ncbi:MAG TPA: biopolymer transporter ExbD [Flavobacteriaceae bacterium]|nr:biopolymer transporter ExbD [Flavobacteriaceae bacterium]